MPLGIARLNQGDMEDAMPNGIGVLLVCVGL